MIDFSWVLVMLREVTSRGGGGEKGGLLGDLREAWLGLCCGNPSILDLILFKAKCFKIATLSKTLNSKIEYFLEENLYYAERHIPSELNMEVPPPPKKKPCAGVYQSTPKGTIFHIWRRRNDAFVDDDISSNSVACVLKINFTTISFKGNTKFSVILIVRD